MKLKRSTQGLLLAALLLGTGVAIYEGTIAPGRQSQENREATLLSIAATDIQAIEIETPAHTLRFERLAESVQIDLDGDNNEFTVAEWEFVRLDAPASSDDPSEAEAAPDTEDTDSEATDSEVTNSEATDTKTTDTEMPEIEPSDEETAEPEETEPAEPEETEPAEPKESEPADPEETEPAEAETESTAPEAEATSDSGETPSDAIPARQAYMDFLFGAIERASRERAIDASADSLGDYGLDAPPLCLTLELTDGTRHILELGERDFTQSFVYATLDRAEDAEEVTVLLLPPNLIDAIDRDLEDWDATIAIGSDFELPDPAIDIAPPADPDAPEGANSAIESEEAGEAGEAGEASEEAGEASEEAGEATGDAEPTSP